VTKEKKSDQSSDKAVPSLATWRHHEDGTEIIQEANLRLKVNQTEITPKITQQRHLRRRHSLFQQSQREKPKSIK
jgi:hypothetical protein